MIRIASAAAISLFTASLASAQAPPPAGAQGRGNQTPPAMTNLQIFPKDTPRPQVIQAMQQFQQALGVRCVYCHVDEPGNQDFASDAKPTKKTAREMILLAREINTKLPAAVGKDADDTTRVGCMTCHRGVAIPKSLAEVLGKTVHDKGVEAAGDQYRALRKQYYGSMAYDFSENGLIAIAQGASAQNQPETALAALRLNLEFYPDSSRTYLTMAQVYGRQNDKENQIKSLEKAIQLDPKNEQASRTLEQLRKQQP